MKSKIIPLVTQTPTYRRLILDSESPKDTKFLTELSNQLAKTDFQIGSVSVNNKVIQLRVTISKTVCGRE